MEYSEAYSYFRLLLDRGAARVVVHFKPFIYANAWSSTSFPAARVLGALDPRGSLFSVCVSVRLLAQNESIEFLIQRFS